MSGDIFSVGGGGGGQEKGGGGIMAAKSDLGKATRFKSGAKAAENGRKGGKNRANQAGAQNAARELLALLSDQDTQKRISVALVNEAIEGNNAGSVTKAFETIRDTIGEKPVDKIMVSDVEPGVIAEIERMVNDDTPASS